MTVVEGDIVGCLYSSLGTTFYKSLPGLGKVVINYQVEQTSYLKNFEDKNFQVNKKP